MANCGNNNFLSETPPSVYKCNTQEYPEDVKEEKLINMILRNEGGYNLFDDSSVSGETYRGIDRKNGGSNTEFWAEVDRRKAEYFQKNKDIVTYTGTNVTEEYRAQYGNKKVKSGTYFDNDENLKSMAIKIYSSKYYKPNGINLIKNPMIAGHTLSQASHYGSGATSWIRPLVNAINSVCGTNIAVGKKITEEMLKYINSDKACEIANEYTRFRREQYARSNQTKYIKGWLNMVNNCVKYVNENFK